VPFTVPTASPDTPHVGFRSRAVSLFFFPEAVTVDVSRRSRAVLTTAPQCEPPPSPPSPSANGLCEQHLSARKHAAQPVGVRLLHGFRRVVVRAAQPVERPTAPTPPTGK